ncbi:hypothetical protein [Actinomadura sp. CNU-125]|uniref:hypothetical protein n=1 Tax=Actinomadura sp. CNU-125 TaxID=1904961 RepID=UPI0021CC5F0B|nr:hypothetical protein [Actinomadura sp. CNU-125]
MSAVHQARGGFPRPGLALALLAFAQLIISLDYNIVYVALPEIADALDFSAQSLQWVISAYAVAFGGFLLLAAAPWTCSDHAGCSCWGWSCTRCRRWRAGWRPHPCHWWRPASCRGSAARCCSPPR